MRLGHLRHARAFHDDLSRYPVRALIVPVGVDPANDVGDAMQELVNFDILRQDLEEVLADVALASCLDQAGTWVHVLAGRASTLVAVLLLVVLIWALTSRDCLNLLSVHVERRIVLDDAQSSSQVHEFECLRAPVVDLLSPVVEPGRLAKVGPVEQVHLLLHRLHLSCLL